MKIVLATGADEGYFPRIWPYLRTIERLSQADRNVVFVPVRGKERWFERIRTLSKTEFRPVDVSRLRARNPNNCLQHGEFLDYDDPDGRDDDLIVFTDGDICLQRWFEASELEWLAAMGERGVAAGYNEGPFGTLDREARLLHPHQGLEAVRNAFPGDWESWPCLNTGVLIAKRAAYRRLCEAYVERFPEIDALLGHYAKQQWLLSWLIHSNGFTVELLPGEIHTHGCHPLPLQASRVGDELFFSGKRVMFRHNVEFGPSKERTGLFRHHLYGRQPQAPAQPEASIGQAHLAALRASVIVYSRDSADSLIECFSATLATIGAGDEVIVVDDASADRSPDVLMQLEGAHRNLRAILLKRESGVCAAWNRGLEVSKGEVAVFLRPHAIPAPGWLDALCAHARAPRTGAAGPLWDRQEGAQCLLPHLVAGLNGEFTYEQIASLLAELNLGLSFTTRTLEPHCIAIARSTIEAMGGWDEGLFGGAEVLDLCWRLQEAGLECRIACDALVRSLAAGLPDSGVQGPPAVALLEKVRTTYGPGKEPHPVEIWGARVLAEPARESSEEPARLAGVGN